jgi:hypothetical protein
MFAWPLAIVRQRPVTNDQRLTTDDGASTMSFLNYFKSLKPEQRLAWFIAVAADALQIGAFPLFAEGALSPADSLLDLVVGFLMVRLLGWHFAFLPSFAAKLIPGADLFPTWTTAVWFVTRKQITAHNTDSQTDNFTAHPTDVSVEPEILPPGPAPAPRR